MSPQLKGVGLYRVSGGVRGEHSLSGVSRALVSEERWCKQGPVGVGL